MEAEAEAKNEASATPTTLPAIGAQFQGGIYAGVTCDKTGAPYALVLLEDKPASDVTWQQATEWARGLGADLPTRVEGALLFQNLRSQFAKRWHWLAEQYEHNGSYAWNQSFYYGHQYYGHKSSEFSARAVRRFDVQSFIPSVTAPQIHEHGYVEGAVSGSAA